MVAVTQLSTVPWLEPHRQGRTMYIHHLTPFPTAVHARLGSGRSSTRASLKQLGAISLVTKRCFSLSIVSPCISFQFMGHAYCQ